MKKILQNILIGALALVIGSCGKEDSDVFVPIQTVGADTNWLGSISSVAPVQELKQALFITPKIDSCQANVNSTVQFQDGLQLYVPANAFTLSNGQSITGSIQIEELLIKKKGDMIRLDKPTVSNGRLLVSSAELFLNFRKNGEELKLAPGKKLHWKYNDIINQNMRLFRGEASGVEKFNWIETQDSVFYSSQGAMHYEVSSSVLKWSGLHTYADTTGQRLNIEVSLAANYTNANTLVFLVYKDMKSVVNIYGNPLTKKFLTGKHQIGKQASIIVISKQGNNSYYFASQNFTIGLNSPSTVNQVIIPHPQPTSITDIRNFLETL